MAGEKQFLEDLETDLNNLMLQIESLRDEVANRRRDL